MSRNPELLVKLIYFIAFAEALKLVVLLGRATVHWVQS